MELSDVRRDNLRLLTQFKCRGVVSRLAHGIGRQPSYMSRLMYSPDKAGAKRMGEGMARHIEDMFMLPHYSLDFRGFEVVLLAGALADIGWRQVVGMRQLPALKNLIPDLIITNGDRVIPVKVWDDDVSDKWVQARDLGLVLAIFPFDENELAGLIESYLTLHSENAIEAREDVLMAGGREAVISRLLGDRDDEREVLDFRAPIYRERVSEAGAVIGGICKSSRFARLSLSMVKGCGVKQSDVFSIKHKGDSMLPRMADASLLAVDRSRTEIRDGRIYAINQGGMLRVRAVYTVPGGGLRLRSDNCSEYPDEIYTAEQVAADITILGWVFFWSQVATW